MTEDCGCEHEYVNGEGCRIIWCSRHQAAEEMEETLKEFVDSLALHEFPIHLISRIKCTLARVQGREVRS